MKRVALVAPLGLLLAAHVALAAPPWSKPDNVSVPASSVDGSVTFDGAGRAYATWDSTFAATGRWLIAVRPPGGAAFGPQRATPRLATEPVRYGRAHRLLVLGETERVRHASSLHARFIRPDGSFGRPDTITTFYGGGTPSLAVHDDAVAAWGSDGFYDPGTVRAAIRHPGGRFGRPVILRARVRAMDVVTAAGPGVLVVAWERGDGAVEARVRLAGLGWGPVRRIGPAAFGGKWFRAAFSGRRGYLAWLTERDDAPSVVRVAVLPAGRTRFSAIQTLDTFQRERPFDPHGLALAPLPGRGAMVGWTRWDGRRWRVRAALAGPGLRFEPAMDVSPPREHAVLADLAAIPADSPGAGTVLAVWGRLAGANGSGNWVRAALRPPGGSFGPPEDVTDRDGAGVPDVAFDSVSRSWTAVWQQQVHHAQGAPFDGVATYLRAATRPG